MTGAPKLQGRKKVVAVALSLVAGLLGNCILMVLFGGFLKGLPMLVGGALGGICFGIFAGSAYQGLARVLSGSTRFAAIGYVMMALALPWLAYVFWKYRNGPYVSTSTAIFDCLPLLLFFGGVLLCTQSGSKKD